MTQGVVGAGYRFERSIRDEPPLKAGLGVVEQVEQGVGRVGRPGILPDARSLQRDADRDVPDIQGQHHHAVRRARGDRKSTRLNSSHRCISYAVFCLKKKKKKNQTTKKIKTNNNKPEYKHKKHTHYRTNNELT